MTHIPHHMGVRGWRQPLASASITPDRPATQNRPADVNRDGASITGAGVEDGNCRDVFDKTVRWKVALVCSPDIGAAATDLFGERMRSGIATRFWCAVRVCLGIFVCQADGGWSAAAAPSPNIIVYMADDLGWNHLSADEPTLGTHAVVYRTPHIGWLAQHGLSFTHAYAQPNCAPTRAAMLSGQYPARVHNQVYVVGHLNRFARGAAKKARFRGAEQSEDVAPEAVTVAEALKRNGYATAHIGKYHVGGHGTEATLPERQGFDINLGGFSQGHQPVCFASQQNGRWVFRNLGRGDFDRYAAPYTRENVPRYGLAESLVGTPKHICDALGDAAVETIGKLAASDRPFYLQFHSYAVHGPVRARPDLREEVRRRVGDGQSKAMIEYLGFIAGMDKNLGRILAAIEDPNGDGDRSDSIAANTLVLFTSDNGGIHAPNDPLRGKKGMFTEGGIRVPLIAYWKGVIPAHTVTHRMVHAVDYYPTYLELAGNRWRPPAEAHPLDGESFAEVLRHPESKTSRGPVYYLFPGYLDTRAAPCAGLIADIRGKRYKLFYFYEIDSWELYCLTDDIGESHNLVAQEGEIAATLSRRLHDWLTRRHPTWRPRYPLDKDTGQPAGPPPVLSGQRIGGIR